ncbi:peptidase, U32 family small subunit, C1 [Enterococcus mundtii 1A]|uniref:peptidase U32 family protein n=1 Tax=Enterococcus TaxID=1350 RepID=UPI0004514541|nr:MULTISPECIES: peptidase U32 family protein [Enterococcus]AZP94042.1 U32 family peptidase [Enterococcus mundtii]EYT95211.1 peptidase family U32 [Enterococcus mundtii CRL35]MDA9429350.1 peptidase, U32 family small subunit, C1 [Enterococcus mundtii 1A]MDO7880120.1 peptidase U32 family protein [Enterococcus mundtii]MEC3942374.1 peptidase U32 family protein [Enterococcus mundtii]
MIEIITTIESMKQAEELLEAGVDTLYFGEERFGLRLPASFTREEQRELVALAHRYGKKVNIAVNGIIHPEKMKKVPEYLQFLKEINVDMITVGDTGIIYTMRKNPELSIPYVFDAETLVTSARQINFWAKKGAISAVLAREVPFDEMKEMENKLQIPVETLVYGATCIHQSKRPLLQNYYNYTQQDEKKDRERGLFLAEPKKEDTHYSIYEDSHGTHIFANNDINLSNELPQLYAHHFRSWKLDGVFTPGEAFVEITKLFVEAKKALLADTWTETLAQEMTNKIIGLHPTNRGLDTGFFYIDPESIK